MEQVIVWIIVAANFAWLMVSIVRRDEWQQTLALYYGRAVVLLTGGVLLLDKYPYLAVAAAAWGLWLLYDTIHRHVHVAGERRWRRENPGRVIVADPDLASGAAISGLSLSELSDMARGRPPGWWEHRG